MGHSDSPDERFDLKELREWISRRKLLIGAATVGGGLLLTSQPDSDEHLTRAEDRLGELATTIDAADVVDPQQSWRLSDAVTEAVASVNDALDRDLGDDRETKDRLATINAATAYYINLGNTLDTATNLLTRIATSERTVLEHEGTLGYDPVAEFDTIAFEESIARLSKAENELTLGTAGENSLIPDQQRVVDALRAQRDVYNLHITAQQTYLDTATMIEAGTRAQERSHFDKARSILTEAQESLTAGIPTAKYRYRLSGAGLSLEQYATLLTLRREGVTKLLSGCEPSLPVHQRRAVSDEAIDRFFESRRVVTSSTRRTV